MKEDMQQTSSGNRTLFFLQTTEPQARGKDTSERRVVINIHNQELTFESEICEWISWEIKEKTHLSGLLTKKCLHAISLGHLNELKFIMERLADEGNVSAAYFYGMCYKYGYGQPADRYKAYANFRFAADAGYPLAYFQLGEAYMTVADNEEEWKNAFEWMERSANCGIVWAQMNLALMYMHGKGCEQNYQKAVKWFRCASESGYGPATNSLALRYLQGVGVEQSFLESRRLFELALEQGTSIAGNALALLYALGIGGKKDVETANRLLSNVDDSKFPEVNMTLAMLCENPDKKLFYLERAAKAGIPFAKCELASMLYRGEGCKSNPTKAYDLVMEEDYTLDPEPLYVAGTIAYSGLVKNTSKETAISLWQRAEERGHADASYKLGVLSLIGECAEANFAKARLYFEHAVRRGHESACFELSKLYDSGLGGTVDELGAFNCLTFAAQKGHTDSLSRLGLFYYEGRGVERDVKKAIEHWTAAANNYDVLALFGLGLAGLRQETSAFSEEDSLMYLTIAAALDMMPAMRNCGVCYLLGIGCEPDYEYACEALGIAAQNGDVESCTWLAICNLLGKGQKKDARKAFDLFKDAANRGSARGLLGVAICMHFGIGTAPNVSQALDYFNTLAREGVQGVQTWVGKMFADGKLLHIEREAVIEWLLTPNFSVNPAYWDDLSEDWNYKLPEIEPVRTGSEGLKLSTDEIRRLGIGYLRQAAEAGNDEALIEWGKNVYVNMNDVEAFVLFDRVKQLADENHPSANYLLAKMYEKGKGVERNANAAFKHAKFAAENEMPEAMDLLGRLYFFGKGCEQNFRESMKWFQRCGKWKRAMCVGGVKVAPKLWRDIMDLIRMSQGL